MTPIDAVYWWGVATGASVALAALATMLLFRTWFLRYGPDIPDFTGEHHDGSR